jgi:hypothetical protein
MNVPRIYKAAVDRVPVGVAGNVLHAARRLFADAHKCILVGEEHRFSAFGYREWGTGDGIGA